MQSHDERHEPQVVRIGGRSFHTTPAYDTYWRFAAERQAIFFRRLMQEPSPWSEDSILRAHRFTNVYRASDRVSQFLIRNVIYEGEQSETEIFFRTVLFKIFNRIETWQRLLQTVGTVSWREFDYRRYNSCFDQMFGSSEPVYSAAYIMPSPTFGEARKHSNHLRLIEHMMRDDAPAKMSRTRSLAELFRLLRGYPSLGDFLAFQLSIDLNYSEAIDFSEMEFVMAGPGARDGISKCFAEKDIHPEIAIQHMAETANSEFTRLNLSFRELWRRPLQLIDCQNVFCELSKYARVKHPDLGGTSGRTRIKQKFKPNGGPLPQMYPAKWRLTDLPSWTSSANTEIQQSLGFAFPNHCSSDRDDPESTDGHENLNV